MAFHRNRRIHAYPFRGVDRDDPLLLADDLLGLGSMIFRSFSGQPIPWNQQPGTWACMICSWYVHSPVLSQGPTTSRVCEAPAPAVTLTTACPKPLQLHYGHNLSKQSHSQVTVSRSCHPILALLQQRLQSCSGHEPSWSFTFLETDDGGWTLSEMSNSPCFKPFHFFKSRALHHPAFRTCPKELFRVPSSQFPAAVQLMRCFWPRRKSFSAHHGGSLAMLINHILLIPPSHWCNGLQWYPGLLRSWK